MVPAATNGLYDSRFEHDACGVGMVARLDNVPTHEVVSRALTALENLEHRGANGADPKTGDGAGILMQMPDELFRGVAGFGLAGLLPAAGTAVAPPMSMMLFHAYMITSLQRASSVFTPREQRRGGG